MHSRDFVSALGPSRGMQVDSVIRPEWSSALGPVTVTGSRLVQNDPSWVPIRVVKFLFQQHVPCRACPFLTGSESFLDVRKPYN